MSSSRSSLLPFGSGTGDEFVQFDNVSSKPLIFDVPFKFFGTKYKQITVRCIVRTRQCYYIFHFDVTGKSSRSAFTWWHRLYRICTKGVPVFNFSSHFSILA